jgi:hypothetical protein
MDPDPRGLKTHGSFGFRSATLVLIGRFDHLAAGLLCLVDEDVDLVGEDVDLLLNLLLLVGRHTCNTQ